MNEPARSARPATDALGSTAPPRPRLVRILPDRSEGESYPLAERRLFLGRSRGDAVFPEDRLMSGLHASVRITGNGPVRALIRDEGSRNGVFVRIREPRPLSDGDTFAAGSQLFRFRLLAPGAAGGDGRPDADPEQVR